ncbi:PREDICTED: 39S ribosomal protein L22, mitochondrial [Nicrophorus vespilloides]|uniref:Large ribosomal subunit protein uL22m n=1 Tax=Nicrophorus vespilloides TaxID=110193 RepID=A0ABM1M8B8_NICVS|nr:PREDICTED: 39S ribosomal protein L22, mitochondrial [Nicrophorus vespilloides]
MALYKVKSLFQLGNQIQPLLITQCDKFHTTSDLSAWSRNSGPKRWLKYNDVIYPPQSPDEEPRPAFVCHQRTNIKYSPWKMWYIASLVRGMSVDEAIKQLKFVLKKGSKDVMEVIEEARELAIKEHNVQYGTNLWVAESFVGKGQVIKGMRRHGRMRHGLVRYFHCHYFVRLEEGTPPKDYYMHAPKEPSQQLQEWLEEMRKRKIINSL